MLQRIKYIGCLLFIILLAGKHIHAQGSFPVMATVQINPPYSLYLSDYTAPDLPRMQVHLLLKDLATPEYRCRLRFKIEGFGITMQSKADFYTPPVILNGGEMLTLSGPDLAVYLNPQNLLIQGLDNSAFTRQGAKLPEGIYKFTVEVLDYTRNVVVSNAGNAIISSFLSYPPIINLPMADTKVTAMEPQNVIFQWMPRHTASPNAAFNVAYKFRLVELNPPSRDPNDALRTTRPIYETLTEQTLLVYGPGEPMLTPGNNYAVHVQAIEAEGKDMFINDGFSEAVRFTYGEKCGIPQEVIAAVAGRNDLKITWTAGFSQQAFSVRYRETGDKESDWYEEISYLPQVTISGLKPGKKYEYQVKGQCIWGYGEYTEIQSFSMPDEELKQGDFVCGKKVNNPDITNKEGIDQLKEDDEITAGDFKVKIKKAEGTKGTFSGTGRIAVPFLNSIVLPVVFKNISVNTDKKMYAGVIELEREDETKVSENMNAALDKLMDKITDILESMNTDGLKLVDAAGLISEIDKMKGWDELDTATKEKLGEIQSKLQELQELQENTGMTPEEKASGKKKIAEQLKKLAEEAKAALKAAAELLEELLGIFRKAVKDLRKEFSDEKLKKLRETYDVKKEVAEKFIANFNNALQLKNIVATNGESIITEVDVTKQQVIAIPAEIKAYIEAKYELEKSLILKILDDNKSQTDESKVVEELKVKEHPLKTFVKKALKEKIKEDDFLPDVKQSIVKWIDDVLEKLQ